ncbi:hypothetical protein GCM10011613_19590 [Cellvibrio zantedeschiae]|uniref:Uncharacterized protein n=1 Tax=Cellvibrio zantedeschiae TaxID=1237077 RepID=A0ABQ3B450_9GAMM|nr:hypothetical protein [Cellvibrio zantedeschiae]GGY74295.1 hypothetical protein GCM10011613_19590 [Cellvibrio zantedeschiae]
MPTPSRLMPKYKPQPFGVAGWLVLLALVSVGLYIFWVHPFVSLSALAIVLGLFVYERFKAYRHFGILVSQRVGESLSTFAREQNLREIDTFVVRAVYEEIRLDLPVQNFPLRWSDNLYSDLLLTGDEMEDLIERVALRAGRCIRHTAANPLAGKILTVGDLIAFFNHQPQDHSGLNQQI